MSTAARPHIDVPSSIDPTPGAWPGYRLYIPEPPTFSLIDSIELPLRPDLKIRSYVRERTDWLDGTSSWCWAEE